MTDPFADSVTVPQDAAERALAPARPIPLSQVEGHLPRPILQAYGQNGAVVVPGCVTILSGAGGVAKSTLALTIALGLASLPENQEGNVGRIFTAPTGGYVLFVTYEDRPPVTAWRARNLAWILDCGAQDGAAHAALDYVHLLDMRRPLFGPGPEARGLYNARPTPLEGWKDLEAAVKATKPALLVIDPALAAYVGEGNGPAPVREFVTALSLLGEEADAGVLLVAHSNKAARQNGNGKKVDLDDAGLVAGSAAWFDAARAVMTLANAPYGGPRLLSINKANYGPRYLTLELSTLTAGGGSVVGFEATGEWEPTRDVEKRINKKPSKQEDDVDNQCP